ncbi:hypothetical protein [Nocardioides cavernaquae]|uniref:Integral membrane protein n=1 Tax=Nocardioides cavernaquae TaxID=2321396 RepID=A0A3A5HBQ9_9ACTN|nr:hypothetical protein [Nocardioides cavernaquae]RJS45484.1 hypothetical protein D4739_04120 [Nocardioides cavernaquae]
MGRAIPIVVGALMAAAGLLFTLQGLGYVGGSSMSGESFWAMAGPLIAGLGVALIIVGVRPSDRR